MKTLPHWLLLRRRNRNAVRGGEVRFWVVLLCALLAPMVGNAQQAATDEPEHAIQQVAIVDSGPIWKPVEEAARKRSGDISLLNGRANLRLEAGEGFLDKDDAERVIRDLWRGNPQTDRLQGLLLAKDASIFDRGGGHWIIYAIDSGVRDRLGPVDSDLLLFTMRGKAEDLSKKPNNPTLVEVSWAMSPVFDDKRQTFSYAVRLAFERPNRPRVSGLVSLAGRSGTLLATRVMTEDGARLFPAASEDLLGRLTYNVGYRFTDFDPKKDREGDAKAGSSAVSGLFGDVNPVVTATAAVILLTFLKSFWPVLVAFGVGALALVRQALKVKPPSDRH